MFRVLRSGVKNMAFWCRHFLMPRSFSVDLAVVILVAINLLWHGSHFRSYG